MNEKIQVLIADDHKVVRAGIRLLLEQTPDIAVVAEAGDGVETLHLLKALEPDVLLLDIEMPKATGVEVAQQLKAEGAPVRVLVLSAHDDATYVWGLLETGAAGYLLKEEAPEHVVKAVRGVAAGREGYFSPAIAARLADRARGEEPKLAQLTDAELEVVQVVAQGETNRAIGSALGITEKAVEKRLENVFKKLDVKSRTQVAVIAKEEGLV